MKWTPEVEAAAIEAIRKATNPKKGAVAIYIPLNDKIGIKLFAHAKFRDYAHRKQTEVSKHKLAPEAGDTFTLPAEIHSSPAIQWKSLFPDVDPSGPAIFGYITQAADTSKRIDQKTKWKVIKALRAATELNTPSDLEIRNDNFGFLEDNLVYLDFDEGTWS